MLSLIIAVAWAGVVTWLLVRAVRQSVEYEMLGEAPLPVPADDVVTVVIPARNEAATIGRCLGGILAQGYPDDQVRVIVVDDQSTDATAEVARRHAAQSGRVSVVDAGALPEGWTGKSHSCQRGAELADGEWLCFLDADTAPGPNLLASAVAAARQRRLDMLSLEPRQELESFWERLIVPCGMLLMAFLQDLRRINDPRSQKVAANGQCLLVRREAYEAIDGHAAVAGQISEDTALARCFRRDGRRFALLGGESLLRVRMYTGFRSLWEGFSKNAVVSVGGRARAVAVAAAAVVLAVCSLLAPLGLARWWLSGPGGAAALAAMLIAALASVALFATHLAAARHFDVPGWYGLLFPLGYLIGAAILLNSALCWTRGNVGWKGRVYRGGPHLGNGVSAG